MSEKELLSAIKETVLQQEPSAEIFLFGSYARGDFRQDSDIDLLILVNKESLSKDDEKKITRPLYDLQLSLGKVISPFIKTKHIWYNKYPNTGLFINIQNEGKQI